VILLISLAVTETYWKTYGDFFSPLINPKFETELKLKEEKDEMSYGRGIHALPTPCILGCLASRSLFRARSGVRVQGWRLQLCSGTRGRAGTCSIPAPWGCPAAREETGAPIVAQRCTGFARQPEQSLFFPYTYNKCGFLFYFC